MSRLTTLERMYQTFKSTGILLLFKRHSVYNLPSGADDVGYYFYSLIIASLFQVPSLVASRLFFKIVVGTSFFVLVASFSLISCSLSSLLAIGIALIRLWMPLKSINPVYTAYLLGCIPIPLLLLSKEKKSSRLFEWTFFIGGLLCSVANIIRVLSSLPTMVFYGIWISFVPHKTIFRKITLLLLFFIGYFIPYAHYQYCLNQRTMFLKKQGITILNRRQNHLFWHNIYTGLGFLNNDQNITWSDTCGANRALEINPKAKYPSKLYETTIRNEIFRLCRDKRYFIATTIFAKLGVILYFFLIYFGPFGVVVSWFYPKPWYLELAFWASLGASTLPGLLTIPVVAYLLGFIVLTVIYSLYSYLHMVNRRRKQRIKRG